MGDGREKKEGEKKEAVPILVERISISSSEWEVNKMARVFLAREMICQM
jgi:hypothetical protein